MGVFRYKPTDGLRAEVDDLIANGTATEDNLDYAFGRYRVSEPQRTKPGALWRLTIVLWLPVWLVLLLVVCPLNWLATGDYFLGDDHVAVRILQPWADKITS